MCTGTATATAKRVQAGLWLSPMLAARHVSHTAGQPLTRARLSLICHLPCLQIKRCKTDAVDGLSFDDPNRPECINLLTLYQLATGRTKAEVAAEVAAYRWGDFKPKLADALVEHLRPIQTRWVGCGLRGP